MIGMGNLSLSSVLCISPCLKTAEADGGELTRTGILMLSHVGRSIDWVIFEEFRHFFGSGSKSGSNNLPGGFSFGAGIKSDCFLLAFARFRKIFKFLN